MENNKSNVSLKKKLCTFFIPEELIVNILLRLPARSVVRFRCVCKLWRSLISNPQFAQLHYDLATTPTHRFLLRVTDGFIESIDPEACLRDKSAVLHLRLPPPLAPLYPLRCNVYLHHNRFPVCGSCRGFVLIDNYRCLSDEIPYPSFMHDLIVWNPLTGVYKQIPLDFDVNGMNDFLCGFGYDASTDDYLVIYVDLLVYGRSKYAMIKLFSLKSNSWDDKYIEMKDLYFEDRYFSRQFEFKAGSFLDGALHWLVTNRKNDYVIMTFDLVDRSLSEILLPPNIKRKQKSGLLDLRGLRVIGGCLCVWVCTGGWNEMWMMKEYKVLSSWVMSFRFGHDRAYYNFSPICLTKDNALFGSYLNHQKFQKVCGESEWLRENFTYGKGRDPLLCNLQCYLYRESLLSLPTQDDQ